MGSPFLPPLHFFLLEFRLLVCLCVCVCGWVRLCEEDGQKKREDYVAKRTNTRTRTCARTQCRVRCQTRQHLPVCLFPFRLDFASLLLLLFPPCWVLEKSARVYPLIERAVLCLCLSLSLVCISACDITSPLLAWDCSFVLCLCSSCALPLYFHSFSCFTFLAFSPTCARASDVGLVGFSLPSPFFLLSHCFGVLHR